MKKKIKKNKKIIIFIYKGSALITNEHKIRTKMATLEGSRHVILIYVIDKFTTA